MRLIDAHKLKDDLVKLSMSNYGEAFMLRFIDEQPTIDPETLSIVQQLREELNRVTAERDALKMNPPVQLDGDTFDLACRLAKVTAKKDAAIEDLRKLKMKNEVLLKLLSGERVKAENLVAATGGSFVQCCKRFELSRVAEWWSIVGKTDEERSRNGQKITFYFCLPLS